MKVVRHTSTELTLQERRWLAWIVGVLFIVLGSYTILVSGQVPLGGIAVAVGLGVVLFFAKTETCTFDIRTGQFTYKSQGLLNTV